MDQSFSFQVWNLKENLKKTYGWYYSFISQTNSLRNHKLNAGYWCKIMHSRINDYPKFEYLILNFLKHNLWHFFIDIKWSLCFKWMNEVNERWKSLLPNTANYFFSDVIDPFVQTLWQQRNFSSLFCLSCMESSFSFMSILSQRRQTLKNTNTSRIPFKYMDLSFATLWSILLCWPEMKQWEKLSGRRPRWVFAKTKLELQNRFITDSGPKLKSIYK